MALVSRTLDVAPELFTLARALRERPGLLVLWDAVGSGPSYLACDPTAVVNAWDPEPDYLGREMADGQIPRWFGVLPYEAGRGVERKARVTQDARPEPHYVRPEWWRFGAVVEVGSAVRVVGDDRASVEQLSARLSNARRLAPAQSQLGFAEPLEAPALHIARIQEALRRIRAGELYQVNLARRFELKISGYLVDALEKIAAHAPSRYCAAFGDTQRGFVSTSPELFLELKPSGVLRTTPIKGTRPRVAHTAQDLEQQRELEADPKERAELAMILDVERNDLGRLARTGSVRLSEPPHVETFGPVHHRLATLEAQLKPGIDRTTLLNVMLPSGSVTGAPKIAAMDTIAELEPVRRGLYTGAYGALNHDGGLRLAMAIRVLSVRAGQGHYYSGGGIVADSDPGREVEETLWKARQLVEVCQAAS